MRQRVDVRWVRRTLARVQWLRNRADCQELADALFAHGANSNTHVHIRGLGQYLEDVAECLELKYPKQSCAMCGIDLGCSFSVTRRDVRYCSSRCRQRAYRKRVTARKSGRHADAPHVTTGVTDSSTDVSRRVERHGDLNGPKPSGSQSFGNPITGGASKC
jgi:hypothetical protein